METIEQFQKKLEFTGCAVAPNGVTYKMTSYGNPHRPAVERTFQGNREIIVGFHMGCFETMEAARRWAVSDGRYEFKPGVSIWKRKQIC